MFVLKQYPILLLLSGMTLPFSIAISNIIFGAVLLLTLLNRQWWQGAQCLHQQYPWLLRAWLVYMALFFAGLAWSSDFQWGLHMLTKQWSWLLVPAILGSLITTHLTSDFPDSCVEKCSFTVVNSAFSPCYQKNQKQPEQLHSFIKTDDDSPSRHNKVAMLIWAVSAGLLLHLMLCSIQSLGLLPNLNPGVSSTEDATGMLGRIGFGLIYGVWAALLVHQGVEQKGWYRAAYWGVALWAVTLVFLAQGRSGYLIILILSLLLARKLLFHSVSRMQFWLTATMVASLIVVVLWQSESLRHRLQWTAHNVQQAEQGDLNQSEARLVMWYGAWRGWLAHPLIGVGTGGFPKLSQQMAHEYGLQYDGKTLTTHPHQMYLLDLARWGPLGLLALLALFAAWIAIGWHNMEKSPYNTLIVASGVALAVHGLSAPSLEEYYGSVYGALFLSMGLAGRLMQKSVVARANFKSLGR